MMGFQSCKTCVSLLVFMYLFASTTGLSCYLTRKWHNIYMLTSLLVFWVVYVVCKIPVKCLVPPQSHFITLSVPHIFQITDHICFWSTHNIPFHLKTVGKIKHGKYLNFILLVIFLKIVKSFFIVILMTEDSWHRCYSTNQRLTLSTIQIQFDNLQMMSFDASVFIWFKDHRNTF